MKQAKDSLLKLVLRVIITIFLAVMFLPRAFIHVESMSKAAVRIDYDYEPEGAMNRIQKFVHEFNNQMISRHTVFVIVIANFLYYRM